MREFKISEKELRLFLVEWRQAVLSYNTRTMRLLAVKDRGILNAKKKLEARIKKYSDLLNSD